MPPRDERKIVMKLLLISGMGESVALAHDLSAIAGHDVICVTEGRAVARAKPPAIIHDGTFETDADFARYIAHERFDMVVDAAHPFDFRLGAVAQGLDIPYLRAVRERWMPKANELWVNQPSIAQAVAAIPSGARVFVATGRGSVFAFENRPDVHVLCRQLVLHTRNFPLPIGQYVFGEGPFSITAEMDVFKSFKVDHLLLHNSGSVQGRSKVDAACALGIQVMMIDRPNWGLAPSQITGIADVVKRVADYADY